MLNVFESHTLSTIKDVISGIGKKNHVEHTGKYNRERWLWQAFQFERNFYCSFLTEAKTTVFPSPDSAQPDAPSKHVGG